jgi:leucyl aminopeptidase
MQIDAAQSPPTDADVLALGLPEGASAPDGVRALDARLARLADAGELNGSAGELTVVHTDAGRIAVVGLGDDTDANAYRMAAATLAERIPGAASIAWLLDDRLDADAQARAVVDGLAIGRYDPARWKTSGTRTAGVERLVLCGAGADGALEGARRQAVVAGWADRCRDLVTLPPNELTPEGLANAAKEIAETSAQVTLTVLGPAELREAGMGAFLGVAQGSDAEPRLMTLRYEPEAPADSDFVLGIVGKAVTFDSGGLSLKPADSMPEMKSDMAGGAAALAALGAIAELGLPVRALSAVGATENMPGGHAFRPGDIVHAANGLSVEITNTDAEGRLVLADVLWHARREGATHIVDLATLTASIEIALGNVLAGAFANDAAWLEAILAAGEASGDRVWPMPLDPGYARYNDSPIADLQNAPEKKRGGATIAALFLERFAGDGPWAHLDIAGTGFLPGPRTPYPRGGATGFGVGLVTELVRRLAESGYAPRP